MVDVHEDSIDVASANLKAYRLQNKGNAGAELFRRGLPPKQWKTVESGSGGITVALFTSYNVMMSADPYGPRATHQSIWVWDGVGIIRRSPIPSYQLEERWDSVEEMQMIYDSIGKPREAWDAMARRGKKVPQHIWERRD